MSGVRSEQRIAALALIALAALCAAAGAGGDRASARAGAADALRVGVVPQSNDFSSKDARMMASGRVESVRVWLPWSGVEAERGTYDWRAADRVARTLAEERLEMLPFLFGSPQWAARRDGFPCAGFDCIPYAPRTTETREAFAAFARAAVERYGPDGEFWDSERNLEPLPVTAWQLWNEPNLSSFYRPSVDPRGYAELVRLSAAQIERADAQARVVLGGLSGNLSNSRRMSTQRFLRRLYTVAGIGGSFDGIAVHPYDSHTKGVKGQIRAARKVVSARSDDASLWVTEVGWASAGDRDWNLVKTRKGQARMVKRVLALFLRRAGRWDLEGAYVYAWRDSLPGEAVCGWCRAAGLVDRHGKPKPAFNRFRRLARRS